MLGHLFRVTEVFLWEDERIRTSDNGLSSLESATSSSFTKSCVTVDKETSTDHTATVYICLEETELSSQMDALGLPLSFGTSKMSNYAPFRSKRKGTKPKSVSHGKEINNLVSEATVFNQMENPASSTFFHDSPNTSPCLYDIKGQTDASYLDAKEEFKSDWHSEKSTSITDLCSCNENNEPVLIEVSHLNSRNLVKSEFSPDAVCFEGNDEVLDSLSLQGSNCFEEVFQEGSQTQFHLDGDLLNKHDLEKCSYDSSTSYCNTHLEVDKDDTQTLQRCSVSAEFPIFHPLDDDHDNFLRYKCGDWRVIWDPFYQSNYFFNVQTQESTWYPPSGLETYAFSCSNLSRKGHEDAAEKDEITDSLMKNGGGFHFTNKPPVDEQPVYEEPVEMSAKIESGFDFVSHYTTIGNGNSNVQWSINPSDSTDGLKDENNDFMDLDKKEQLQGILDSYSDLMCTNEDEDAFSLPNTRKSSSSDVLEACENFAINKKRLVRRSQPLHRLAQCLSNKLLKYWCQRYSLFSKFDDGIQMDDESWFSVTPELLAKHHAFRCGGGTIIDCFTGVGGNAIHFAMRTNHVIAIDVDPCKIDYAQHNAVIYGVSERIDFIKGDFFKIAPTLKGDVAFLSPPWGGPDYAKAQTYDIRSLKPHEGYHLFKIASMIATKVIMFLPRNVNLDQLGDLSLSTDPPWNLEVEKNYLNGKLKSITAYFDMTTP